MKYTLILLALFNLTTAHTSGQSKSLRIHLNVTDKFLYNQILGHTELYILADSSEQRLSIDSNFDFVINELKSNYVRINLNNNYRKIDTCQNGIIHQSYGFKDTIFRDHSIFKNDTKVSYIEIIYPLTCTYDKNRCNKTCPKCRNMDQVIPIRYGLIVDDLFYDEKNEEEYYPGGCELYGKCNPNWHCKRDKVEF